MVGFFVESKRFRPMRREGGTPPVMLLPKGFLFFACSLVIGSAGRVKIQPDRLIHAGVSE
jgi:hypothetical protein